MTTKYRILKKLKSGYSNNKTLYGFDTETFQLDHGDYIEQKFMMGSIVGDNLTKVFWNKKEMQDYLMSRKFENSIIFATNLDFDFKMLFDDKKYNIFKRINRNSELIQSRYQLYNDNKHIIEFRDTWNYTGKISVKKMAESLGIKKLDHPECFTNKPKNEYQKIQMDKYNVQDSKITFLYAKKIQEFFNSIASKMHLTLASSGVDYWRRYGQEKDIFQERKEWLELHYKGSLKGGRTECLTRGFCEDVFLFDYNSHYPARCFYGVDNKGSYPNPSSVKYTDKIDEDIIKEYEGISYVELKSPKMYFPFLAYNDRKLLFPTGVFKGWYTNIELRKALKLGYEIKFYGKGLYYEELFKPFRKVVKNMYDLRKKYRDEIKDETFSNMCKLMMNGGLFGKFAQKIYGYEQEFNLDDCYINNKGQFILVDGKKEIIPDHYTIRNNSVYITDDKPKIKIYLMPILSSYTTALGRIKLWKDCIKHEKHLRYMDTDSGVFDKKVFNDSKELGKMKLERVIKEAIFIKPKFYYYKTEDQEFVKCKGVGKYLKDKKDFDKVLSSGEVETQRFSKSKESAIRKVPFASILKVLKRLSFEDDKRDWGNIKFNPLKEQDSLPVNII